MVCLSHLSIDPFPSRVCELVQNLDGRDESEHSLSLTPQLLVRIEAIAFSHAIQVVRPLI